MRRSSAPPMPAGTALRHGSTTYGRVGRLRSSTGTAAGPPLHRWSSKGLSATRPSRLSTRPFPTFAFTSAGRQDPSRLCAWSRSRPLQRYLARQGVGVGREVWHRVGPRTRRRPRRAQRDRLLIPRPAGTVRATRFHVATRTCVRRGYNQRICRIRPATPHARSAVRTGTSKRSPSARQSRSASDRP